MARQEDNTAPAREALAAWDKLHDERESLNQNLDFCNDAAYHQPEGKLSAETVRELATAAVLLEQANALIDKANERQSRKPAAANGGDTTDEPLAPSERFTYGFDAIEKATAELESLAVVMNLAIGELTGQGNTGALYVVDREIIRILAELSDAARIMVNEGGAA